jgi:hypothetical protein
MVVNNIHHQLTFSTCISPIAKAGDRVVVDWEGYTIGYYGRPFQLRNKVKGGAFESSETDYYRWTVGSSSTIQALNEAVTYLPEV